MTQSEFFEQYGDFSHVVREPDGEPVAHIPLEDYYQVFKERFRDEMRDEMLIGIVDAIVRNGKDGAAGSLYRAIKAKLIAEGFYVAPMRQILHRFSGKPIFEAHAIDQVDLIRKAIEADALLRHADLPGLDLSGLDFRGVDTSTWNLRGSTMPVLFQTFSP